MSNSQLSASPLSSTQSEPKKKATQSIEGESVGNDVVGVFEGNLDGRSVGNDGVGDKEGEKLESGDTLG